MWEEAGASGVGAHAARRESGRQAACRADAAWRQQRERRARRAHLVRHLLQLIAALHYIVLHLRNTSAARVNRDTVPPAPPAPLPPAPACALRDERGCPPRPLPRHAEAACAHLLLADLQADHADQGVLQLRVLRRVVLPGGRGGHAGREPRSSRPPQNLRRGCRWSDNWVRRGRPRAGGTLRRTIHLLSALAVGGAATPGRATEFNRWQRASRSVESNVRAQLFGLGAQACRSLAAQLRSLHLLPAFLNPCVLQIWAP